MAQTPNQHGDGGAQFVREIVTDPNNVPDVMLLYGYLGASSEEGHERLYLSPDLTNYVEVPKAAILHRAAAPKEQDPHGGVTLWVKKDAALKQKMAPAAQALAHYFAGAIQAGAAGAQPPPVAAGPITVNPAACPTILCTQHRTPCPQASCAIDCLQLSLQGTCVTPCLLPTRQATCPMCFTFVADCPTRVTCAPICWSLVQTRCLPHKTAQWPPCVIQTPTPVMSVAGCPSVGCVPGGGGVAPRAQAFNVGAVASNMCVTNWCGGTARCVAGQEVVETAQCGTVVAPCIGAAGHQAQAPGMGWASELCTAWYCTIGQGCPTMYCTGRGYCPVTADNMCQ